MDVDEMLGEVNGTDEGAKLNKHVQRRKSMSPWKPPRESRPQQYYDYGSD